MGVNSLPKTVTRQRRDCDLMPAAVGGIERYRDPSVRLYVCLSVCLSVCLFQGAAAIGAQLP